MSQLDDVNLSETGGDVAAEVAALRREVDRLGHRVQELEAIDQIRKLHHKYGYYIDKCLYDEVVELFAEDCEVAFAGGIYRGRAGVERLYIKRFREQFTGGHNGPIRGFLLDHAIMQDIVTIDPGGTTAKGRFRTIMSAGTHDSVPADRPRAFEQWWEGGIHENRYVVEDGVWKIQRLGYFAFWHADYQKGWAHTAPLNHIVASRTIPDDPLGPDELIEDYEFFPATDVVPFHYPHPITGQATPGSRG